MLIIYRCCVGHKSEVLLNNNLSCLLICNKTLGKSFDKISSIFEYADLTLPNLGLLAFQTLK
jgi:hypothetical protein